MSRTPTYQQMPTTCPDTVPRLSPGLARMCNFLLAGADNYLVDRHVGATIAEHLPEYVYATRNSRLDKAGTAAYLQAWAKLAPTVADVEHARAAAALAPHTAGSAGGR